MRPRQSDSIAFQQCIFHRRNLLLSECPDSATAAFPDEDDSVLFVLLAGGTLRGLADSSSGSQHARLAFIEAMAT